MISSRLRKNPKHVFECFLEVVCPQEQPNKGQKEPWILQSYPANYKEKEAEKLKSVPHFVFPCQQLEVTNVQNFSFVLTDIDAHWTFGFCRIAPKSQTALVILSSLPWHEIFYRLLNRAAEITHHSSDDGELWRFLESIHSAKVPDHSSMFHVSWTSINGGNADFSCLIPHRLSLPSIPDNRNLTEYYNACGIETMLSIFASMLKERRIVVTSKKLSKLSACIQAANALIYPMHWQHIFIPVLPNHLIDYLSAPMPFLIGVPAPIMKRVKSHELGEVVVLDADANRIISPFDDVGSLPLEVVNNFRRTLKNQREHGGETIARAFLQVLAHLIGGYREALKMRPNESQISFDDATFLASRPLALQPFLEEMLHLQIFRQFIEERIENLHRGKSLSDEFEKEVLAYTERSASATPGTRMIKSHVDQVRKVIKNKANPAMKTAVKTVREGSKTAYREVKHKIRENQTMKFGGKNRMTSSPSSLSIETSDGIPATSAPGSPSSLSQQKLGGGRRAMSVLNVTAAGSATSTGGSLTRGGAGRNTTGGSSKSSGSSGGLTRHNTDFGFGRVLKYERFDPPPVEALSVNTRINGNAFERITERSPEMEAPPRLDLDLMNDLHDMIYRKPVPNGPPVNRELKPVGHNSLKRTPANGLVTTTMTAAVTELAQMTLAATSASTARSPDKHPETEVEVAVQLWSSSSTAAVARPMSDIQIPGAHPKLERSHANPPDESSSAVIDLISLGGGSGLGLAANDDDVDIFDPLMKKKNSSTSSTTSPPARPPPPNLPRPPSATVAAITAMYEQQQQHKPLMRESANPFRNSVVSPVPPPTFTLNNNNNNTFINYENCFPVTNGDIGNVLRPASTQSTPARSQPQRSLFTKSSEDLLQEYGLDFTKLSTIANASSGTSIDFETPITSGGGCSTSITPSASRTSTKPNTAFDIFADLDPLTASTPTTFDPFAPSATPSAPVAPPRAKKSWTTFE